MSGKRWAGLDDASLLNAAVEGSEAAFREFLNRYQYKVLNWAYRFLGDREEARDVAQETFLRLYRSAGGSRLTGGLKPYVFKIARNLCLDWERKKRPELLDDLPDPIDEDTPLDLLSRKEGLSVLAEAVRELPEKQRTAVLLRHMEGMSYAEIAEVMSISVSAVESLLVRGRKSLRVLLAGYVG